MAAAARAAERENYRRQRIALKEQMINDAADAVARWEEYVDGLTHISLDASKPIDWAALALAPPPTAPAFEKTGEDRAKNALSTFEPGFFDFFWGGTARRIAKLEEAVAVAIEADAAAYRAAVEQYEKDHAEWQTETALAERVLKADPTAFKTVLEESDVLSGDGQIGTSVQVLFTTDYIHAIPTVHTTEIIPSHRRKQLDSGRLSETKMPIGQFNELYQNYVAGSAFKLAARIFNALPINELYVTCVATMLNAQTGHQEPAPIISVQFVRDTLERLDLRRAVPSSALSNFNHQMKFKVTKGFSAITPLQALT